jgi:UDP-glucose 4-epimerase
LGAGYLGAALLARLLAGGERVVALDNGFSTDWPALQRLIDAYPTRATLLRGDLRHPGDVEAAFRVARQGGDPAAVYLLAAQASAHAEAAPAEYTEDTNLRGPRLVYEAALRHGAPPVVYASSFHVYGSGPAGQVDERCPYGTFRDLSHLSKVYAEKLGEMYAATRGLAVAPVRLGIVYGVGPVTKRDRRFVTVPHAFCLRALAGQPLEIHATAAAPVAFVHVDDAVEALLLAARGQGYAPANATGEVATVACVARLVQQAAAVRGVEVTIHAAQSPRPPATCPEPPAFTVHSRLEALGWRPNGRLAGTVPEIFDYYARSRSGAGASAP